MESVVETVFDPDWRDDVFDAQALEITLALPAPMPRDDIIWVEVRALHKETIFDQQHTYDPYRLELNCVSPTLYP
ncbi:MAG: hypothetical protein AAF810_02330 [Cyanobacteria bacterium P01_D01_bin.36]